MKKYKETTTEFGGVFDGRTEGKFEGEPKIQSTHTTINYGIINISKINMLQHSQVNSNLNFIIPPTLQPKANIKFINKKSNQNTNFDVLYVYREIMNVSVSKFSFHAMFNCQCFKMLSLVSLIC